MEEDSSEIGFELAPIGLTVVRHRIVKRCNARFCEIFGYAKDEVEDSSLLKFYPSIEEFKRMGKVGHDKMLGSGRYDDERIMMRNGGQLFWCRARGQSLTTVDPLAMVIWSFSDLSEKRPIVKLTPRERDVAVNLIEGKTSKETAKVLGISHRTVELYRARLLNKYNVSNIKELISLLAGWNY